MIYQNFIGIDISKLTFDAALLSAADCKLERVLHKKFNQTTSGYEEFRKWLATSNVLLDLSTLICMEFTGIYNAPILTFLNEQKAAVWVEMAVKIKQSNGFGRSNNDKTDSVKIAKYAFRFQNDCVLYKAVSETISTIKDFIGQRDRIVNAITTLTTPIKELKEVGCDKASKRMGDMQLKAIKELEKAKFKIETEIENLIKSDTDLKNKVDRVKTIKGIGAVTATAFLVYTQGFEKFKSAKELACFCGVVPFSKKDSGTSVKSKPRVSPFANKNLKTLLHLCALSAMRYDAFLKTYYERKLREGKNKMCVINAICNKLVLRIFAVVRDNKDYVENYTRNCEQPCL